jgi:3-phenylpropionate/trans-cinnamate dioxygenase ferredoxin reductase subunit
MMANRYTIRLGKERFQAEAGELLLDAALSNGVDLPHDCRAGHCGSCVVEVEEGRVLGGRTRQKGCVHACRAHVFSDLKLNVEPMPESRTIEARVAEVRTLVERVSEVTIRAETPFPHIAGQYYRFRFKGYPARAFSPTAPFEGHDDPQTLRLHIKAVRNGRVTSEIGSGIRAGHAVTLEGPFGRSYLRSGQTSRLVLVGSGTGFAPVWAVADAALREWPLRPIVLMAGASRLASLYMAPLLARAATCPNVAVMATVSEPQTVAPWVGCGCPVDSLPPMQAGDLVYAAGSPDMVEKAGGLAEAAGARFYADPFVDNGPDGESLLDQLKSSAGSTAKQAASLLGRLAQGR